MNIFTSNLHEKFSSTGVEASNFEKNYQIIGEYFKGCSDLDAAKQALMGIIIRN